MGRTDKMIYPSFFTMLHAKLSISLYKYVNKQINIEYERNLSLNLHINLDTIKLSKEEGRSALCQLIIC